MSCKIWLTKCHPSGLHNVIIIAESLACMCGRRRRGRRKGKAKQIAFDFFAGARVAQLISARSSVREVPSSIPGDHPCFNFSPFCVAWRNFKHPGHNWSASSTSSLSVIIVTSYRRKIWLLYLFLSFLPSLLATATQASESYLCIYRTIVNQQSKETFA